MAGSDKKIQPYTSFNAGEYSPELAGRVDLESFGSSSRFMSNMMSQISGGIKKFYGTTHIAEITPDAGKGHVRFVPFINSYEPMVLVFWGFEDLETHYTGSIKVGLIYGDHYKLLDIEFPSSINVDEMRWKQINDTIVFVHKNVQPLAVEFYGTDDDGEYIFVAKNISFTEIPYFPLNFSNEYKGSLEADAISGEITLTVPNSQLIIKTYFAEPLVAQSTYTRHKKFGTPRIAYMLCGVENSTVKLIRIRSGVETELVSGVCNSYDKYWSGDHGHVVDTISRELVLQVIQTQYSGSYIDGDSIVIQNMNDHQDGDSYYTLITQGSIGSTDIYFPSVTNVSTTYTPSSAVHGGFSANSMVGRKMKFYFNDDEQIKPWWQSRVINTIGEYAYSNGHWYKAQNTGTCGNIQPSHTFGIRSDGAVGWKYVHSGSGTGTIIDVPDENTIKLLVDGAELPSNKVGSIYVFNNYAWSIWGFRGIHPSEVYMAGNRLGLVCNTDGYGAWNAISVTDDYYNFSTEEYGEQLDTSAIVHLIGNNESGAINWVLARKNVYMGSYSGEYNIRGGTNNMLTPTGTVVDNISNMGGKAVIPLKYKELNMFVGATGKELYTIGYDYTIDDYTPHSLGYLTQHIMEKGVRRIEALNNMDRNIYLLHDTNELSLFNYAREQKVMGFSELDFGAQVLDFASTYANDEVAGYVATIRNDGKITFERLAINKPTYMFDTVEFGDGETVQPITGVTHHAGKDVWVKYENGQFVRTMLDENGDAFGVLEATKYEIGLPMVSELHTQPAFGMKVEGHQQQSLYVCLRLNESGSFEYGSSVDFEQYFPYKYWNSEQAWGGAHRLYTGDAMVNLPLGYAENANQGEGPYPNTTGTGVNLRSDTPEPLNLLSIQEIYK